MHLGKRRTESSMMNLHFGRHGGRPLSRDSLLQWQRSVRGQRLLTLEERELKQVLPDMFGRHILQIGQWDQDQRLLSSAAMLHCAVLGANSGLGAQALIDYEQLPIMSKTVDAVILPHTLEFVRSPHTLLREASRILTDRGWLVILGFNPWSLWGLRERLGLRHRAFPAGARYYGVGRLCDWLALLDLETTAVSRFGSGFPWSPLRSLGDPWSLGTLAAPLLSNYLLVAKKRVIPINRIGLAQRAPVRRLLGRPLSVSGARVEHP